MATAKQRAAVAAALATAIAVPAEGLRQVAYYDPPGILTVCYGHTGADVVAKRKYSLDECGALLTIDMQKAVAQVEACRPGLPVPVLAAFADAAFNLGPGIACSTATSTAARMLYVGDVVGACNQLPRWDRARLMGVLVPLPGLTKRRAAERELCLTGVP
ncbi:Phage-related lysozyme (muramidase), GH24 family [Duganella sp. CF517]|uniref:lysozyme n=1 Tax=Duganella sp. CF517 TaxID=1881038 RepID=UPI0008B5198A|nr:lysozyme [Duganella sp. CF517]SEN31335.1 Phage-related lysozyme (muramidase), GH24 family [Duganella sp. CF517]